MASRHGSGSGYTKRFVLLAACIGLAIIGYTYAWNRAADRLVTEVQDRVAAVNRDGRRANCETPEARGYPFRIGLFCRSVMYVDAPSGVALRAGEFRSAAQVYQPSHVVGELEGPAVVEFPGLNALEVTWTTLRGSARIASPRPERVSLEARDVAVGSERAADGERPAATAALGAFHMRPSGAGADVAWNFERLAIDPDLMGSGTLPLLSGAADLHFDEDPAVLLAGSGVRGHGATINSLVLRTAGNETAARLEGPVFVNQDGLIDADLTVSLENPQVFAQILGELLPDLRSQIRTAFMAVSALGDTPSLPVRIDKGEVSIGFLRLGTLPPI